MSRKQFFGFKLLKENPKKSFWKVEVSFQVFQITALEWRNAKLSETTFKQMTTQKLDIL